MNMPLEVREVIWRALLVKENHVRLSCDYQPDDILWTKSLSIGKGVTTILRVNSRTKEEGTRILYGENVFECYHVRVFKNMFIHGKTYDFDGIGTENAAKIKKAIFGLPLKIIRQIFYSPEHGSFLDFLCNDLTGLQKLTLKTNTTQYIHELGVLAQKAQTNRVRALMATAARTTKYHPKLRKAIWSRRSGGSLGQSCWTGDSYVDLAAIGFGPVQKEGLVKKDAYGRDFNSVDMLLNSSLIRQTSWLLDTAWEDVKIFNVTSIAGAAAGSVNYSTKDITMESTEETAAQNDQQTTVNEIKGDTAKSTTENTELTSEADSQRVTPWPGVTGYDPLLELKPEDQVAMVELKRGKYIHGDFVKGQIVDGKFIRGEWFDTGFVQGKHIAERMFDGKAVESQFAEGEWIDECFVEGKWVDGRLVKGAWADWLDRRFFEGHWVDGLFVKGRWDGDQFIEGKWVGRQFYEGRWSKGVLLQGGGLSSR